MEKEILMGSKKQFPATRQHRVPHRTVGPTVSPAFQCFKQTGQEFGDCASVPFLMTQKDSVRALLLKKWL